MFGFCKDKPLPGAIAMATEPEPEVMSIETLREKVSAIEEKLRLEKVAAAELIEKPAGLYRIVQVESATGPTGYFVQRWVVQQGGYETYRQSLRGMFSYGIDERHRLEESLKDYPKNGYTYIHWSNVGSANPHSTHEDAETWLRKWLRPELAETLYGADGERV